MPPGIVSHSAVFVLGACLAGVGMLASTPADVESVPPPPSTAATRSGSGVGGPAVLREQRDRDADQRDAIARLEHALDECNEPRPAGPGSRAPVRPGRRAAPAPGPEPAPAPSLPVLGALPEADDELARLGPFEAARELDRPARGASSGPRTIPVVECIDYDCPYCYRARATVQRLLANNDDVSFRVLHNPLPMHPQAAIAARAAVAAQRQDQAWPMHDAVFDDRQMRSVAALVAKAHSLGMDAVEFEQDMMSEEVGIEVATQAAVCRNADASGTPTFFVGGDLVLGAQGYDALLDAVESERLERG